VTTFPAQQPGQRVRVIPLVVETLPGGALRVSSPHARGWAAAVRTPQELARAVEMAYREVSCASYARQRGGAYDLDQLTMHTPGDTLAGTPMRRVPKPGTRSKKSHDVAAWSKFDDGTWRSPAGRTYRADTMAVRNVIRKRISLGMSV
jgi:hypothetical protein